MGTPIRSVLIHGSGIAAWAAAATFALGLRQVRVTVVSDPEARAGPLDLHAGTRPSFRSWLRRLGLDEPTFVTSAGGAIRLGQRLAGWWESGPEVFACFGPIGGRLGRVPFHLAWLNAAARGPTAPYLDHSAAVALAKAGRFSFEQDEGEAPFLQVDHGYAFAPARLREALHAPAVAAGVREVQASVASVQMAAAGRVGSVVLASGERLTADLFVEADGAAYPILAAMGQEAAAWVSWNDALQADRILTAEAPARPEVPLFDEAVATSGGWRLRSALRDRTIDLHCHASDTLSEERAARILKGAAPAARTGEVTILRQGRRERAWTGNCLAVGDAALQLEPVGAWPLHLLVSQMDLLLDQLPDTAFADAELAEFNRRWARATDMVAGFVMLHHALGRSASHREGAPARHPVMPGLAHLVALFSARGRVAVRDSEVIAEEDWLTLFIGAGLRPRADALPEEISRAQFASASGRMREQIARLVARAWPHADYLRLLSR